MSTLTPALPVDDRKITWVELFFDLVFVAAVSQLAGPLSRHYAWGELGRYAFLLLVTWWGWQGYVMYATRFGRDDARDQLATMLQMVAVMFMAANAEAGLDSESSAGFAAAYGVMRLLLALSFRRAWQRTGAMVARECAIGFGLAASLWVVSSGIEAPARYGWWALALAIDIGTSLVVARHAIRFPPHAAHLPERVGLFTLIWLGEALISIMRGIQAQPTWTVAAAGTALSGIVLVCGVWWAYFNWTAATAHRPVRCHADRRWLDAWTFAHVPLYLGLGLAALGVEHAVKLGGVQALPGAELGVLMAGLWSMACAILALWIVSVRPQVRKVRMVRPGAHECAQVPPGVVSGWYRSGPRACGPAPPSRNRRRPSS
jgi:low temperature requirement protein LtrA